MPRGDRGRLRNAAVLLAACAVSLLLGEAAVRLLLPRPGWYPFPEDVLPGMLVEHPTRSYQYAPGFSGRIRTRGFEVDLRTNELGLRDGPIPPKGDEVRVLALGDSFTFGFGLQAEQAWPARLQERLGGRRPPVRVVNAGVSAYGLRQMRLLLEEILETVSPDVIVIGVYPDGVSRIGDPYVYFHGYAVVRSRVPRLRVVQDGFLYSSLPAGWMRSVDHWLQRRFHLGARVWELSAGAARGVLRWARSGTGEPGGGGGVEAAMAPILRELDEIRSVAGEVPLALLLVTPQQEDGTFGDKAAEKNEVIARRARERGIPVADPLPALRERAGGRPRFRNRTDYHWSPEAQDLAAAEVAAMLDGRGLLPR